MIHRASSPNRLFLSWDAPACCLVAQTFLSRPPLDPQKPCFIVVPSREAARFLREQLAIQSAQIHEGGACLSPRIIPLSQLVSPEAQVPPLSHARQELICVQVLLSHAHEFKRLFPHCDAWNEEAVLLAAQQLLRLFQNLAKEALDSTSPLWPLAEAKDARWEDLRRFQLLYREELARLSYHDPCASQVCSLPAGAHVILAAVPHLSRAAQLALSQGDYEVELWLHARPDHDACFDAWGRPNASWLQVAPAAELGMDDAHWRDHFVLCADAAKLCQLASERTAVCNAKAQGALHAVALGACDGDLEAGLEEVFAFESVPVYRPRGLAFSFSGWSAFLQQLTALARQLHLAHIDKDDVDNYPVEHVVALLKLPLILSCMCPPCPDVAPSSQIALLDRVLFRCIPERFSSLKREVERCGRYAQDELAASALLESLEALTQFIRGALSSPLALLGSIKNLALAQAQPRVCLVAEADLLLHRQFTVGLLDAVEDLLLCPDLLQDFSCQSLLIFLAQLCQPLVAQKSRAGHDLSLLGWLELSYCPAQHLVLCGLYDKLIPERWGEDIFLTPMVREALALPTDEDRAARDAYLLRSMLACRPQAFDFYFSLYNSRNDPQSPSSLLLRLCPEEFLVELTELFFSHHDDCPSTEFAPYSSEAWAYPQLPLEGYSTQDLLTLKLSDLGLENPLAGRAFSPSLLKGFLQCPLRFWVQHIYHIDSNNFELGKKNFSAAELGNCLHSTLEHFITRFPSLEHFTEAHPKGPEVTQEAFRSSLIAELRESFDCVYKAHYNTNHLLPQELQRVDMLTRVEAYADVHLALWEEGWQTARDEKGHLMLEYSPEWSWRGHAMNIKIDRVDTRWANGIQEFLVIDYKTGRQIESCEKEHLTPVKAQDILEFDDAEAQQAYEALCPLVEMENFARNSKSTTCRWSQLQLPFYVAFMKDRYPYAKLQCGYILLSPKRLTSKLTAWASSDQEEHFAKAFNLMDSVMCLIERGECLLSAEQLHWKVPHDYVFPDWLGQESLADVLKKDSN